MRCSRGKSSLVFLIFFYWSDDHRDLHSFPTRRSSDLAALRDGGRFVFGTRHPQARAWETWHPSAVVDGCQRSEEHTSELQSHVNLVCRLLLEKKNAFSCGLKLAPTAAAISLASSPWRV